MPTGPKRQNTPSLLLDAAARLRDAAGALSFSLPVAYVYNPLDYAWRTHKAYIETYGGDGKAVLFLGMNPGPWGMSQTGVPFGEIAMVRDWLGVEGPVEKPPREHPRRPVLGFRCSRSEVSGRRLWGLFYERFGTAGAFFRRHFVANYCPLVFLEESGRNRTPDKIGAEERERLFAVCDEHLRAVCSALKPHWVVGIGAFAEKRATAALQETNAVITRILHPSPASPAANGGWAQRAAGQLEESGIWSRDPRAPI